MHFDSIVQGSYQVDNANQNNDEQEEPESSYSDQSQPDDSGMNEDDKDVSRSLDALIGSAG